MDRTGNVSSGVDFVFDLAGWGNMAGHKAEAEPTYQANLMRVINTVNTMGDARLIFISTSSVTLPVQTYYSASKKACEEYLKVTGKRVAIARPYTITGVGDQADHLIPKLIDSCLNGTEMPFVPEPVHDFVDVEDFVDALMFIREHGQFTGEIYDIGSGHQIRNEDVKDMVEKVTGKKANLKYVENMRAYDTKDWRANNERICSLGWKPTKPLLKSIQEMYERTKEKNNRH